MGFRRCDVIFHYGKAGVNMRGGKAPVRSGVDDRELRGAGGLVAEEVDDKGGVWLAVLRRHVADAVGLKNAQNLQSVTIMLRAEMLSSRTCSWRCTAYMFQYGSMLPPAATTCH